jgi:hypothetical protein
MNIPKGFVIYSLGKANEMIEYGCKLLKERPDRKDEKRIVFIFENNKKLQEYLDKTT